MLTPIKRSLKRVMGPLIYRFPPSYLSPFGLHLWFACLLSTRDLDGVALEIGCYLGATAALSARYLAEIGSDRGYQVLDTFSGHIDEQVAGEVASGGTDRHRHDFSGNTPRLARWVMDRHGGASVKMIVGDITRMPERELPERIAACLLDIGLAEPTYVALRRIYPGWPPEASSWSTIATTGRTTKPAWATSGSSPRWDCPTRSPSARAW